LRKRDTSLVDNHNEETMSTMLGLGGTTTTAISRCEVCDVLADGSVVVRIDDSTVMCEVLDVGRGFLALTQGDVVLVWSDETTRHRPVVLGRIAGSPAEPLVPDGEVQDAEGKTIPDTLLLEAKESMTLRVGDGSITIRADGKILIKGKDLVSHAQRVNRIKGGSVAIN
jgi:hypothetical protein